MTTNIPKFSISDVTKLAAEGGHMNTNENLINMSRWSRSVLIATLEF